LRLETARAVVPQRESETGITGTAPAQREMAELRASH
jgi:hypothetical protein